MKADLTRRTFDPLKHFTRVLMQQGRVQLDADWNEQTAELLYYLRALAADLIGQHGGPAVSAGNVGFAISALSTAPGATPATNDFAIGSGHYYVDGILCEADSKPIPITGFPGSKMVKLLYWPRGDLEFRSGDYVEVSGASGAVQQARITGPDPGGRTLTLDADVSAFKTESVKPLVQRLMTYLTQPDYPASDKDLTTAQNYLVFLDVWERLITYVEDDSVREVALGGPDTTARSKIVAQVKVAEGTPGATTTDSQSPCVVFTLTPKDLSVIAPPLWSNRGWLKAKAKQDSTSTDPCIISPGARYRGPENQLYRVEIHRPGVGWGGTGDPPTTTGATFKWSRENGSAIYPIVKLNSGGGATTVFLENLGRDVRFGLREGDVEGDWVEVIDDDYVLQNRAEPLLKVHSIDRTGMSVTLEGTRTSNVGEDFTKHPLLRRWDHKAGERVEGGLPLGSDGAALILEGSGDSSNWLELEDGVKIQFQTPDLGQQENQYRTGDYWLIPARTATGDVEWPRENDGQGNPIAKQPDGIEHHYAPLAVIKLEAGVGITVHPCQKTIKPAAK